MGSLAVLVTGAQPPGLLRLGVLVLHLATPCVPERMGGGHTGSVERGKVVEADEAS
jgi:hypothetical protein